LPFERRHFTFAKSKYFHLPAFKTMLRLFASLFHQPGKSPAAKGAYWEKIAAKSLRKEGYKIVARNWTRPGAHGELDIVAKDSAALVFVEVRSRGAAALVGGYASITRHKKDVLHATCLAYLSGLKKRPTTYRFDAIEISYRSAKDYELRHFKNIPLFD
jgi:putative endonuclease